MAVKVADTLRPNNSGDEPVKGGFPTALACDVWLSDGRSVEEAIEGTSGASIQVAELPEPSETQFGKIYQYIGETTDDYINGYFYECIIDGAAYKWVEKIVQKSNTDISQEEDNIIEQKADGLYAPKTTAIIYVNALPEYGTIDDYIYRIQNNQYKELVIDGSIMNGNDPQAAVDHITSKGFVVNDPDEPDHEGYYEAVFKFRDIEYHDELTDQYPMIAKFYIRKSVSIVGDKFIAKTTTDGETYTELAFSSEDMITLRYKEETMYLGDKESQSLARMVLYSDLDTLDIDAVIYDDDLPIPADRKNKVYCTTFTNDSLVFDTTNEHYLYDIVDYARKNNFTIEYSTEYYVIIHTSSKEVYQTSDRSKRVGKIEVYISNNVTLTIYDTANNVIGSVEDTHVTLDLITETLTPYLCQIDSATSFKLLSYDEYKSSILTRVVRVPEDATSGFYQEDLYTNVVIKWTSIESVIASLESSGFTVTPKESDPSQYWIDFPNNYTLLRISDTSLEEYLSTKDLCERMDLKMSGSNPEIGVYCNGTLRVSFVGSNFKYATEQDSTDKNGTKLIAVDSDGDKTRLAIYDDYLRSITQIYKLPEATEDNQGKIYQYVGKTVGNTFVNGCFYQSILDETTSTRKWAPIKVQASSGGETIVDVYELPDDNIENVIYRLTKAYEMKFKFSEDIVNNADMEGARQYLKDEFGLVFNYSDSTGSYELEIPTDRDLYYPSGMNYIQDRFKIARMYYGSNPEYPNQIYFASRNGEGTAGFVVQANVGYGFLSVDRKTEYHAGKENTQTLERLAKYDETDQSFIGTQAEWDELPTSEKEAYDGKLVNIIDGSDNNLSLYADTPIGTIAKYGGTTAPDGWLLCDGRALNKTEYADLFNAIGTNYGGSGSTFNLPALTQCKQDYTVKTQLDTWSDNLEDGSKSHTFTIDKDGSYYFEVVLSNATGGKQSNNITITENSSKLVCSWGFVGPNAVLQNKTIFLKAGTYIVTHICKTAGIGGNAVVTVYDTRSAPVGSYIIKAKQTPVPADFMNAVDEAVDEALTPTVGTITRNTSNTEGISEVYLKKSGKMVMWHCNIEGCQLQANEIITFGYVPQGFRPDQNLAWTLIEVDFALNGIRAWVTSSGEIQILSPQTITQTIRLQTTYFTD